jgi:hypothetical protein
MARWRLEETVAMSPIRRYVQCSLCPKEPPRDVAERIAVALEAVGPHSAIEEREGGHERPWRLAPCTRRCVCPDHPWVG